MASVLYKISLETLCRKLKQSPSVVLVLATAVVSRGSRGAKEAVHFITGNIIHYFEVVDEGDKNLKARCTLVHL